MAAKTADIPANCLRAVALGAGMTKRLADLTSVSFATSILRRMGLQAVWRHGTTCHEHLRARLFLKAKGCDRDARILSVIGAC